MTTKRAGSGEHRKGLSRRPGDVPAARSPATTAPRGIRDIVERISDAFFAVDREWRYTYVNERAAELVHRSRDEIIGRNIWEVFPEAVHLPSHSALHRAMSERIPVTIEQFYAPTNTWFESSYYPSENGISIFSRDITARKEAEQAIAAFQDELARQLADVTALHQFVLRLTASRTLKSVFDEVLAAVTEVQGTDSAALLLYDARQERLYPVASTGLSEDFLGQLGGLPFGAGVSGCAVRERRTIAVTDLAKDPDFASYLDLTQPGGYRALYSVPLISQHGEVNGALTSYFRTPRQPAEREAHLVDLYAHFAAAFIETVCLIETALDAIRLRDEFLDAMSRDLEISLQLIKGRTQLLRQQLAHRSLGAVDSAVQHAAFIDQVAEQMSARIGELRDGIPVRDLSRIVDCSPGPGNVAEQERGAGPELASTRWIVGQLGEASHVADDEGIDSNVTPVLAPCQAPLAARRDRPSHGDAGTVARFLATVPIFRQLDPAVLQSVARIASINRIRHGQFIFLKGDPIRSLWILTEGSVKILQETEDGRAVILRLARPGEVFGIVGVGGASVEPFSAQANDDATVLEVPTREFLHLLNGSERGMRATLEAFGTLLRDAAARICDLQTRDAECRLARALIHLATRQTSRLDGRPRVSLALTRQDLADLAGTNVSTASRAVSAWVKAGIIATGREWIAILDYSALRRIAKGTE